MRLRWALLLLVLLGCPATAQAAVSLPAPGMVQADGSIDTLTRVGPRIILTGSFQHIGPYVGGGVALDPDSGARDPGFARFDGQISDVIGDGSGGWFVGGQFLVEGRRRSVAHVLASGALDPDFDSKVGTFVTSLARSGDRLYAGRFFGNGRVAAMDTTTGAPVEGFASDRFEDITELELVGNRLFVGTLDGLGAMDATTGARDMNFGCGGCDAEAGITALAQAGGRLYVGSSENGIYTVDPATGARQTGFAPHENRVTGAGDFDQGPLVFLVDGDRLLVGGVGMELAGPSSSLVALDLETGAADPSFGRGFANAIHDMVLDGDTLLVAGAPSKGRTAPVIKLDAATGAYRDALVPKLDGPIDALAAGGKRLFVGGRFGTAQTTRTDRVAAIDVRTGRLVPGFAARGLPDDELIGAPVVAGSSLVYAWDDRRNSTGRAMAFSARTGVRKAAFTPSPFRVRPWGNMYGSVWAADAKRVYAAYPVAEGEDIWPEVAVRVLSAHSGDVVSRYRLPYDGYVDDLLAQNGQLFATGSFRRWHPDGRPRHLATVALDPLTGTVDQGFDAHTNGPVGAIVGFADRLYLSGGYDIAYGLERQGSSSAYDNTGAVVPGFNPEISVFGTGGGFLDARNDRYRVVRASPYTGRAFGRVPAIGGGDADAFVGDALISGRGAFVTATINLPYDRHGSYYDNFAGFLPSGG